MIADLLDVSRLDRGTFAIAPSLRSWRTWSARRRMWTDLDV